MTRVLLHALRVACDDNDAARGDSERLRATVASYDTAWMLGG